jgi:hypothetical protein
MRIEAASAYARSLLPAHVDWVDRAKPAGDVVLLTGGQSSTSALETAYNNLSIGRVYYICQLALGPEFGERPVTIDRAGRLRDTSGLVDARYAVVPAGLVPRGRIVAVNAPGDQILVAPSNGHLVFPLAEHHRECQRAEQG